jgi:carbonic anhydrase
MGDCPPDDPIPPAPVPDEARARVYDFREWSARPAMRRQGAPRALWARAPVGQIDQEALILPAAEVSVPFAPAPAAPRPAVVPATMAPVVAAADAVLLVTCAESRLVEQLRTQLPTACVLQNLGGVLPRSPRAPRAATDVATIDAAIDDLGVRHVVCVGHLGCHVTQAPGRYGHERHSHQGDARARDTRAIEHHVFTQLQHFRTYLRQRGTHPAVRLSGLWIEEETGHVFAFDPSVRRFAPLRDFDLARYSATVPARGPATT